MTLSSQLTYEITIQIVNKNHDWATRKKKSAENVATSDSYFKVYWISAHYCHFKVHKLVSSFDCKLNFFLLLYSTDNKRLFFVLCVCACWTLYIVSLKTLHLVFEFLNVLYEAICWYFYSSCIALRWKRRLKQKYTYWKNRSFQWQKWEPETWDLGYLWFRISNKLKCRRRNNVYCWLDSFFGWPTSGTCNQ